MTLDATGNIYVGDYNANQIFKITQAGIITAFAGGGGPIALTNGIGTAAIFGHPFGLAIDISGNLFVADQLNHVIRKISMAGYTISPALPAGLVFDSTTGIISGTPTTVSPTTVYTITANNASGSSSATISITVALIPQTITFPTINPVTYAAADFVPGATASSALSVNYTSSNTNVATIVNNKIHVVGTGTTTITASQTGNGVYAAATPVSQTLTVTPATLTVTAVNQTKVYGAANPALTVTYSGFVGSDNASVLTTAPTISTTALTGSPVNSYPITASGAAGTNYNINYVAGVLTITKANLTITAVNQTKVYGSVNPAFTVNYTGFVGADNALSLTATPVITTTALSSSPVNTYPVTASGATAANYSITYFPGVLTVTPAPLVITADNQSRGFAAVTPTLTATYTGFVNGDTQANLVTKPTLTTTAVFSSAVGTYPITATGAASSNYTISYTGGTLTVTPALLLPTNFAVTTIGATCKGSANGMVKITAALHLNYTATITGGSLNTSYPFTDSVSINNLAAGTYNVCIAVAGNTGYQQCYSTVIAEPKDLSVYIASVNSGNQAILTLGGAATYNISLNGKITSTSAGQIILSLSKGVNNIVISTDKPCQGAVERSITVSDEMLVYPNPFDNMLNISLGNSIIKQALISVYSLDGKSVYTNSYTAASGVVPINMSQLKPGMYILKLSADHNDTLYKIIKR